MDYLRTRWLVTSERGHLQVIARADVLWLQAADNYVELHTAQRAHLLHRTLDALLADLGPGFVRIYRSRAVALAAVSAVEAADRSKASVVLSNAVGVGFSRVWRKRLRRGLRGDCLRCGADPGRWCQHGSMRCRSPPAGRTAAVRSGTTLCPHTRPMAAPSSDRTRAHMVLSLRRHLHRQ